MTKDELLKLLAPLDAYDEVFIVCGGEAIEEGSKIQVTDRILINSMVVSPPIMEGVRRYLIAPGEGIWARSHYALLAEKQPNAQ